MHRGAILDLCATHYSAVELSLWTDALQPNKHTTMLMDREFPVAEEGGQIPGFGVLELSQSLINATYVSPKTVRRGVGRRLVEAPEEVAKQGTASRLHLNSTLNGVPFCERLGYLQREVTCNRLPTGTELPGVVMTKDIASAR